MVMLWVQTLPTIYTQEMEEPQVSTHGSYFKDRSSRQVLESGRPHKDLLYWGSWRGEQCLSRASRTTLGQNESLETLMITRGNESQDVPQGPSLPLSPGNSLGMYVCLSL